MLFEIDFASEEAIYTQVMNQVILAIATNQLQEGDSLPSVRSLADAVGINMHTVNKAYGILRQEGYITIDRRKGAVIAIQADRQKNLAEMKELLRMALARGCCKRLCRDDIHNLIDEILDEYNGE